MRSRSGFTLLELLIVIALSVLFSTLVIISGHTGENGVAMTVEETELSQLILRAKSLSVTTYTGAGAGCGDGIHIDAASGTYSLFVYSPSGGLCPSFASTSEATNFESGEVPYDTASWKTPVAQGLKLGTGANPLEDILFYPPEPVTLISQNGTSFMNPAQTSYIYLEEIDGTASATIAVSPTGQVTVQ
jgi:prepilin-type N-terminal cleavage/methylation domain-containing protein